MADFVNENRRESYIGEKRKFLRDGYGTYVFENKYFRYEGEWMKGKKHGHGKLLMKDGTYYEGQFINGEINGNGYKYFSSSKARYTGQFLNGEMHGHGTMLYFNGNQYEGQWYKNKKQGFGVLRTGERSVYEGTFHGHVRDGEGTQTYDNGDRYEGYWVLDKRQGHGDLWCADGSHYSGQFNNDLFHGEGSMAHASGIVYRGLWNNGLPIIMASKIVLLVDESPMIIRQGQPFAIRVECRNDDDELIEDQGRELQVIAGFKYRKPKEGSALFDVIEDVEDKPIPTPFYDVVPYPLTDQLSEMEVTASDVADYTDAKASGAAKNEDEGEDKGEEEGDEEGLDEAKEDGGEDVDAAASGVAAVSLEEPGLDPAVMQGSQPMTPVEQPGEDATDDAKGDKTEEVTHLLPPVQSKPTVNGVSEWNNLQLAPPPPMYRPFVIMEEEAGPKKKSKLAQIRDRMDEQDQSEEAKEGKEAKDEKAELQGEGHIEVESEKDQSMEQIKEIAGVEYMDKNEGPMGSEDYIEGDKEHVLEDSDIEKKNSMTPLTAQSKQAVETEKSVVSEEKFARTGEYILIVQDVTNPPFMGKRLEPAYLVLKLKKPKRIIVKKPKWDTQRHIAMAMSRSGTIDP